MFFRTFSSQATQVIGSLYLFLLLAFCHDRIFPSRCLYLHNPSSSCRPTRSSCLYPQDMRLSRPLHAPSEPRPTYSVSCSFSMVLARICLCKSTQRLARFAVLYLGLPISCLLLLAYTSPCSSLQSPNDTAVSNRLPASSRSHRWCCCL